LSQKAQVKQRSDGKQKQSPTGDRLMSYGFPWSEAFIRDMADKEFRDEFVAEKIRSRIAMLIRALREQPDRDWSQTRLGQEMDKPQSVISRIEDPDYGKLSLQTLLEVAAAFDLPLWVDIPEWEDWARLISDVPSSETKRRSFDERYLLDQTHATDDMQRETISPIIDQEWRMDLAMQTPEIKDTGWQSVPAADFQPLSMQSQAELLHQYA
jgi:hypothetical protein